MASSWNSELSRRDFLRLAAAGMLGARLPREDSSTNLTDVLEAFVSERQIAGAVGLVSRSGHVLYLKAVGYQDVDKHTPMRPDTIFDMRSMTKAVTAIAVMCLVEDRKISLNDAVSSHLPEFVGIGVIDNQHSVLRPPSRPVAVLDLLTNTSGMATERPPEIENITRVLDRPLSDVVRIISKQPLRTDPGPTWRYSSMGFSVLGRIVEVRSGKAYEEFVHERIFRPLKMEDSFFFPPRNKWSRIAAMYNIETGELRRDSIDIYRQNAKYSAPEFGMFSTAHDTKRLFEMMLNEGVLDGRRVLSPESVRTMLQPRFATELPGMSQGLAWFVCVEPEKQPTLRISKGSFGDAGASGVFGWADPDKGLIRLFLIQRFGGSDSQRDRFMGLAASVGMT